MYLAGKLYGEYFPGRFLLLADASVEQLLFGIQTHLIPRKYEDCATSLCGSRESPHIHTIQVVISLDVISSVGLAKG